MKKHIDYSIGDKRGRTPIYLSWCSMMQRCYDKNSKKLYKRYIGRGIKVCYRWHTFSNFLEDMGNRPRGKTLDRINNNKDYSPNNCKWSTPLEQTINSKTTKLKIEEVQLIKKICSESNIKDKFISKMFKASVQTINNIRRGKSWIGI